VTLFPTPRLQFADLVFLTPSGKIELASARAEELGLLRVPQPHADAPAADGRLRILSPASLWLMNSSYGNDRQIGDKLGAPTLTLHPDDAKARGIAEGDAIVIGNAGGELPLIATISEIAQPGMGIVYKSRWTGPAGNNINLLVSNLKSDMAESTALHATEVSLRRA
jgi:anaerobic selenocysteine-containing dehydrogenase